MDGLIDLDTRCLVINCKKRFFEREREKERERQKDRCVKKMRKRKTDEMTSSNGTLKRFEKKEMYDISWL